MRALVIGATGLLGTALMDEWDRDEIVGTGSEDADIRDSDQVHDLLGRCRPKWTVLAAAYTDVDECEKNPDLAYQVNCLGAVNVARAAREFGSKLLFVSTDYVFDGSKCAPYETDDAICPINVYGRSKAEAESKIREIVPDCCLVRTSWLFGAHGKCFPNTILELAQKQEMLSVVADQTGRPTFNRDLARALIQLVRADARGTFHVTNSGECTWYEFAREVLQVAGMTGVSIAAARTEGLPRPAQRPKYSVLSAARLRECGLQMRPWRETLLDYFTDRAQIQLAREQAAT